MVCPIAVLVATAEQLGRLLAKPSLSVTDRIARTAGSASTPLIVLQLRFWARDAGTDVAFA